MSVGGPWPGCRSLLCHQQGAVDSDLLPLSLCLLSTSGTGITAHWTGPGDRFVKLTPHSFGLQMVFIILGTKEKLIHGSCRLFLLVASLFYESSHLFNFSFMRRDLTDLGKRQVTENLWIWVDKLHISEEWILNGGLNNLCLAQKRIKLPVIHHNWNAKLS